MEKRRERGCYWTFWVTAEIFSLISSDLDGAVNSLKDLIFSKKNVSFLGIGLNFLLLTINKANQWPIQNGSILGIVLNSFQTIHWPFHDGLVLGHKGWASQNCLFLGHKEFSTLHHYWLVIKITNKQAPKMTELQKIDHDYFHLERTTNQYVW